MSGNNSKKIAFNYFGGKFSFSPVEKLKIELEYHRYIAHKEIGDVNSNRFRIMIRHSIL